MPILAHLWDSCENQSPVRFHLEYFQDNKVDQNAYIEEASSSCGDRIIYYIIQLEIQGKLNTYKDEELTKFQSITCKAVGRYNNGLG